MVNRFRTPLGLARLDALKPPAADPVKRGPAPLSARPYGHGVGMHPGEVAWGALASAGNTLRPAGVLIPETPREARAEYVAARERGETVERALSRARAELVAHRVLTWTDARDDAPDGYGRHAALDTYDVDPRELAAVTSNRRTAVLAGERRDVDTGELILSRVVLPDGATARVYVYADDDSAPEDECYTDEDREAWRRDKWRYVGVLAVVTLADGARGEASLWGIERGDYWPGSDAAQVWHAIPDLVREAAGEAADAEPDPENIPEDDRATCGTCHRSWNARTLPTPAGRCPWEHEHEDEDDELSDDTTEAFPGVRVTFYRGESDDRPVVHVDTDEGTAVRVNLNDGPPLFDGAPESDETPAGNLAAWVRGIVDELDPEGTEHDENHDPDYAGGVGTCPACWGDRLREVLDARDATREA